MELTSNNDKWTKYNALIVSKSEQKSELKWTKKCKFFAFKGFIFAALSGTFYSTTAVIVKLVTNIHPGQLGLYCFLGIFLYSLPEAIRSCENLLGPKELRFLLFIRSLSLATNSFLAIIAYRYLPLGEATVILFSFPALVTIAARIFLKEPCGVIEITTIILTFVGVFFTARIPTYFTSAPIINPKGYSYGLTAALIAPFLSTVQVILLRKMKHIHHAVIMINLGWMAIIEMTILTYFVGDFNIQECGYQTLYIIFLGMFSYMAHSLMTLSCQCEFAGSMSTTRAASDIILSFLWQTFIFNNMPDVYSITGAILVLISFVLVGMNQCATHAQEDS